jgi:TIR domain
MGPDTAYKYLVAFSLAGEQREFVRAIAVAVRRELGDGKVFLDEWFEYLIAGQDGDIKLQEIYGRECALAVVCVSERYGNKPWTQAEHEAIRARYMKARASGDPRQALGVLPIRVGDGDVPGIPFNAIVPDVRTRSADDTAKLIIDRLREIMPDRPAAGRGNSWPEEPPALRWPMADHTKVREAFAAMLTRDSVSRCLLLRGPSEAGKSHITRQMLANTLRMPGIDCGRFDFKGTSDMDATLRVFVQDLDVPLPPPSPKLSERLGSVLAALKQRAQATLLIFDTYEAVSSEAQEWMEKELLPSLVRATWLRVVIVGQRTPERVGAIWEPEAAPVTMLEPPPAADWYAYAKPHRPDLTLSDVETGCRLAQNRASILSQLFGPAA